MRQKLTLITLGVSDLKKSLEFYEKGLGWKKSPSGNENIAFFPLGGMVLGLYPKHLLAKDANMNAEGNGFSGVTLSFNAKSGNEVDEVLSEVKNLGATIIKPAQKVFWGGYSGYFQDPDGHILEVAFNPFWKLDENDNLILP
ncbi:MAG: VOC family protein [Bacteroidota bacterium]|nr:VOC family protein [Bacteroidota bacterium]